MGCIQVHFRKDWNRLNNLIYQEHCFRSLCSLMCGDTHNSVLDYAVPRAKNLYLEKGRNGNGRQSLTYLQCMIKTQKKRARSQDFCVKELCGQTLMLIRL